MNQYSYLDSDLSPINIYMFSFNKSNVMIKKRGNMKSIQEDIVKFEKSTKIHHKNIRNEPVWLFLATLGCWSVEGEVLRIVAMVISMVFFVPRIFKGVSLPANKTYSIYIKDLRDKVLSSREIDTEKVRLTNTIDKLEKKYLRRSPNLKIGYGLYIVMGFYGVTFFLFWMEFITGRSWYF